MKRKLISAEESFKRWKKDPKYVAAYDALEKEFALASALIKARSEAEMTQEQVAEAMGTTQAVHVGALRQSHTNPLAHQFCAGPRSCPLTILSP
jgi:hypothetical protein